MDAVFDTNIVIDALNGIEEADREYLRYDRVFISQITWIEVLVGAGAEETNVRDFLQTYFTIIPVDQTVAELAVQIRRAYKIRLPDAIIWATAKAQRTFLVTRNTKDFNPSWEDIYLPYTI